MREATAKQVRRIAGNKKKEFVTQYMRENWDAVLNSSVAVLKTLNFKTRFRFAFEILFAVKKNPLRAYKNADAPGGGERL